jgi:hypothetical protein
VRRHNSAKEKLSAWENGTLAEMQHWGKFMEMDWRAPDELATATVPMLNIMLDLHYTKPVGKKINKVEQVTQLIAKLPASTDPTTPPTRPERRLACTVEQEGGYHSKDAEAYLVRRLKMFHLVHEMHLKPATERVFCPHLPDSRAVGYASHKGQRLGVEKLTEHVRLCIRHEDQTGGGAAAQGGGAGGAGADA